MVTDIVGGSIGVDCNGSSTATSQIVSATEASANPAIQTISPAETVSAGILSVPAKVKSLVNLPVSTSSPFKLIAFTLSFIFAVP